MQFPGYKILRKINQGGMATVYLAMQESLKRPVALKVMAPALNADPIFSERFQREAKIVSRLSHTHIVAIYDVGQHNTYNFIAMDYIDGGSIADKITQGLTAKEALAVVQQMAEALDHAHNKGYIHRDIKPENILLRKDGTAVLSDFGVARAVSSNTQMTSAGTVVGTPNYMSPEQARGKTLDGRSDIYSLGIVFYEMLVGQPPYVAEEPVATAILHLTAPVPKLPPKFADLQPLLNKMAAKKTQDRYQTGAELSVAVADMLERLNSGTSTKKQKKNQKQKTQNPNTRARVLGRLFNRLFRRKAGSTADTEDLAALTNILESDLNPQTPRSRLRIWIGLVALSLLVFLVSAGIAYWYWQTYERLPLLDRINDELSISSTGIDSNTNNNQATVETEITPNLDATSDSDADRFSETPVQEGNVERPLPDDIKLYPLSVTTKPKDAVVRIMNIKQRYTEGIELPPGEYLVDVQKVGYFVFQDWISLSEEKTRYQVELQPAPVPGDKLQDTLANGQVAPELTVVGTGSFVMGSLKYTNTQPRYEVLLDQPFAVSTTEITFKDFQLYLNATGQEAPLDQEWGQGNRPVINVSWNEAFEYTQWLSRQTGETYHLPSEAQWEAVASNWGNQEYPWPGGVEQGREGANCKRGCRSSYVTLFGGKTAPVATYTANALGVFDLGGNVAEWVADCYSPTYPAPDVKVDFDGCNRVIRGGSFMDNIEDLNVYKRDHKAPEFRDKFIGFRVVRRLPKITTEAPPLE